MSVLLITFDLNDTHKDYNNFYNYITQHPYAQLSKTTYAVLTEKTPDVFYSRLRQFISDVDTLLIFTAKAPWYGRDNSAVLKWLQENLG
jgi:hypothetical protein